MAERSVAVRLGAKVDQYVAAMKRAEQSTANFSRGTQRNLQKVGGELQTLGRSMTLFVSAPIALAGAGMVKAAIDWESAWAGVTKTVEGSQSEMAGLAQGLRDMAKELPATHGEIAAVAEAAGALGVATPDIEQFTRTMIDLGETTDLTSDQAATSIAQIMNVMGTAGEDVDNLGSALVDLGNNGASTESQILELATRIASAGAVVGLTEQDVLGFAAAMADVGINAEAGGTAFSRMIQAISKDVDTGGGHLTEFAEIAGMTSEQFVTAFRDDPAQAISAFLTGLGQIHEGGGNLSLVLDDLGFKEIRLSDTTRRLALSHENVATQLDRSAQAWADNTALTAEAEKRYATTAAQFEIVRNKIVDLGIDLGRILLPAVELVVDIAGKVASAFQALPRPVQELILLFGGVVAAIGPLTFVAGTFIKNLKTIATTAGLVKSGFGSFGGTLGTAGKAFGLLGIAAAGAFAGYQLFTSEQRTTEQNTRAATEALNSQFDSLIAAAVAATRAGQEIDGVALANQMLSRSVAEGNTQLAEAASVLNVSVDDLMNIFQIMKSDNESFTTTIDNLARSFGFNAEQADFLAHNYALLLSPVQAVAQGARDQAAALGISNDELDVATDAIRKFFDAADETTIQTMVRDFLNGQFAMGGFRAEAIRAAESQLGVNRNVDDAIPVLAAYNELLANATDEQLAAAGITEEVQAQIAAMTGAVTESGDAVAGMTGHVKELGVEMKGLKDPIAEAFADTPKFFDDIAASLEPVEEKLRGVFKQFAADEFVKTLPKGFDDVTVKAELMGRGFAVAADKMKGLSFEAVDLSDALDQIGRAVDANWMQQLRELSGLQGPSEGWINVLGLEEIERFADGLHQVSDPQRAFIRSQDAINQAAVDFTAGLEENNRALDTSTDAGLANRAMFMDWMDAILDGADAQLALGDSTKDVTRDMEFNIEALRNAAIAAGFNEEQVNDLIDTYMNVPEMVETAVKISGQQVAIALIEELLTQVDQIPPSVITQMQVIAETEGAWAAYHFLNNWINNHGATVKVSANTSAAQAKINALNGQTVYININGVQRYKAFAEGGYVDRPTSSMVGEAGPEVVLPLSRPKRMSALLSDPRVFGPLSDAMGGMGSKSGWGGAVYYSTQNVTVNMPPGSNGEDVVRALRTWQRHNGPIPVAVR